MRFDVLTLFPDMVDHAARFGVVGQAIKQGMIELECVSPRKFTTNVHQTIDDRPFGGGDGMIMLAETAARAVESIERRPRSKVIHLSPRGRLLTDEFARELGQYDQLILFCSRYGGVDERFLASHVDDEVSIGDYVLSGGELGALVVIDAVSRHLPGVLGNNQSASEESFGGAWGLLEHPQYTRPREWRGVSVPKDLLSGDHAKTRRWKTLISVLITCDRRPDLLQNLSQSELDEAGVLLDRLTFEERALLGIGEAVSRHLATALESKSDDQTTNQRE